MSIPDSNPPQLPPVPAYGEYAAPAQGPYPTQPPAYQPAQYGQQYYGQHPYYASANGVRPMRMADTVISVVLLVLGLIGTLIAFFTAWALDAYMQGVYDSYELGTYEPTSGYVPTQAFLVASHLLLLALSTPITIVLIAKRKIAFWVPLSAGVIAVIVFWVALFTLMYSDPAISEYLLSP